MRCFALCLTLLLAPGTLAAQSHTQANDADVLSMRPSARIGALLIGRGGSSTEYDFYGYAGAVSLARSPYSATVYVGYAREFQVLGAAPSETLWSAGLLVGHDIVHTGWLTLQAKAGPSATGGIGRTGELVHRDACDFGAAVCLSPGTYRSKNSLRPGLTGEAEIVIAPVPFIGLGGQVQAVVTGGRSYIACGFSLHVGLLR